MAMTVAHLLFLKLMVLKENLTMQSMLMAMKPSRRRMFLMTTFPINKAQPMLHCSFLVPPLVGPNLAPRQIGNDPTLRLNLANPTWVLKRLTILEGGTCLPTVRSSCAKTESQQSSCIVLFHVEPRQCLLTATTKDSTMGSNFITMDGQEMNRIRWHAVVPLGTTCFQMLEKAVLMGTS